MTVLRVLFLLGIIVALLAYLFFPEAGGMIWHLRHGATADFCGLRFAVPIFYSVESYPQKRVMYMVSTPGRLRNYLGRKVSIIALHQSDDQKVGQLPTSEKDPWASNAYSETIHRPLTLARNSGRCTGFSGPPIWNRDKDVEVWCQFEHGYEAHFSGTELGMNDFFGILETAGLSKGNR